MKLPLWARRLITRLIAIIPVVLSVMYTSQKGSVEEHIALNNLMNNSQVFLALALPFSIIILLMITDSENDMGHRFKNNLIVKVLGCVSVIGLTVLSMLGLPDEILSLFGDNRTAGQISIAYALVILTMSFILALLAWTIIILHKGNKALAK